MIVIFHGCHFQRVVIFQESLIGPRSQVKVVSFKFIYLMVVPRVMDPQNHLYIWSYSVLMNERRTEFSSKYKSLCDAKIPMV